MNKFLLYSKAYLREIEKQKEQIKKYGENNVRLDHKKEVYYGIKMLISAPEASNPKEVADYFGLYLIIKNTVSQLTPNEFITLFPVSKIYDGERWGMKDYFYTMDYINQMNRDEPMGDKSLEFLMEYTNVDIHRFNVKGVCMASDMRRKDGHLDIVEEFLAKNGVETPNTFKNEKGEVMYVRHGRPIKLESEKRLKLVGS